jgi:hypothetical protein
MGTDELGDLLAIALGGGAPGQDGGGCCSDQHKMFHRFSGPEIMFSGLAAISTAVDGLGQLSLHR